MKSTKLPETMKQPFGITAVYLKELLLQLPWDDTDKRRLIEPGMVDYERLLSDRYYRVPFYKVEALLKEIVAQENDPLMALSRVFQLRVKSFPFLGYAISASSTLSHAIERLARLEPVIWDVGAISQEIMGEKTRLIWRPTTEVSALAIEIAISGWISIGKQLFPQPKKLDEITFAHECLGDPQPYNSFFACPVSFEADHNSIVFPTAWLEERLLDSDDSLSDMMTDKALGLINNYGPELNLENNIRAELFSLLPAEIPELEDMANKLGITARKMRYQLQEKNCSYRKIVDDVRKEAASYLLLEGGCAIGDTAGFCGFHEQSSFNRAFKRWFGCAPSGYRSMHRESTV